MAAVDPDPARRPGRRWTWSGLSVILVTVASLATIIVGTLNLIQMDRTAAFARFSKDRFLQLTATTREVEKDLEGITHMLSAAGRLVRQLESADEGKRTLSAFLSYSPFRAGAVYDADGSMLFTVADETTERMPGFSKVLTSMTQTAHSATSAEEQIEISQPIKGPEGSWFRVFASRLVPTPGRSRVIAFVADMRPFLNKLRLVVPGPSKLLLLSPHGNPSPMSTVKYTQHVYRYALEAEGLASFAHIVRQMREGGRGTGFIPPTEAHTLGLSQEAIVAFAPIRMQKSPHWSVATFSPTTGLFADDKQVGRVIFGASVISLTLIIFALYVFFATRRTVGLNERLRYLNELAHLHEVSEKIFDNIPVGVMTFSEAGVVTGVNKALRPAVPESALGGRLQDAFPDTPTPMLRRIHRLVQAARLFNRTSTLSGEVLNLFPDREGPYAIHAIPLEARFPNARVLLVIEDFTKVHALESQLMRAEKLATVGMLSAGVAHEVGTPLGVIRGRSEYLLGKIKEDEKVTASLRSIMEQSDKVSQTIRRLLDFSRVTPATVGPVDLLTVVERVVDLLRYEWERTKKTIEVDVPKNLPAIAADVEQLQQVLVNLVVNACAACEKGGKVIIRARVASREDAQEGQQGPAEKSGEVTHLVRIEVTDDGCGVKPEDLHRIFDPFYTTKKRGQGTGLGLSVVSKIVRSHAATVDIESEIGEGTSAVLLWPVAAQRPEGAKERVA